jgi:hypothetical protein
MTALMAAIALAVGVLALASCGGDESVETTETSDTTTTQTTTETTTPATTETTTETTPPVGPTIVRIVVVGGAPKGGIVRQTVTQGDRVVLVVESDVADEVHLHGYDLTKNVSAGGTARLAFRATLPGRFEVELEDRGVQIAQLTVRP